MPKAGLVALVLLAAAPASAHSESAAQGQISPPPEFIAAAQAFGECMSAAGPKVTVGMTPEAGAALMLNGCAAQRTALDARFEAWVAGPSFPEAGRANAREQYKTQMAGLPAQIADGIRQSRANAAAAAASGAKPTSPPMATPTPAPAPSATPTPAPVPPKP